MRNYPFYHTQINNVGYRFAWNPYVEMPAQKIFDVTSVGTAPQAVISQVELSNNILDMPEAVREEKGHKQEIFAGFYYRAV